MRKNKRGRKITVTRESVSERCNIAGFGDRRKNQEVRTVAEQVEKKGLGAKECEQPLETVQRWEMGLPLSFLMECSPTETWTLGQCNCVRLLIARTA